ncbi:MAG TPA: hypothetical protein VG406_13970 [Isosphaeraceae bacterium]|nr:hypothetical protein [Isosphaeraceae bacterium]
MKKNTIFYSWQSDLPGKHNRNFIESCLEAAITELNRDDELSDFVIDRDTRSIPGLPDIGKSIFSKINSCSLFVADLSIINFGQRRTEERPVPNPNVLFETGYAFGRLGEGRIIGVINTFYGPIDELPFDLRPKRLMSYSLDDSSIKKNVKDRLTRSLIDAIRLCLGETREEHNVRLTAILDLLIYLTIAETEVDYWIKSPDPSNYFTALTPITLSLHDLIQSVIPALYGPAALTYTSRMIESARFLEKMDLVEENWAIMKRQVEQISLFAKFISWGKTIELDSPLRRVKLLELVDLVDLLSDQVEKAKDQGYKNSEIAEISMKMRKLSFLPLVPERPQFAVDLGKVTLALRALRFESLGQGMTEASYLDKAQTVLSDLKIIKMKYIDNSLERGN